MHPLTLVKTFVGWFDFIDWHENYKTCNDSVGKWRMPEPWVCVSRSVVARDRVCLCAGEVRRYAFLSGWIVIHFRRFIRCGRQKHLSVFRLMTWYEHEFFEGELSLLHQFRSMMHPNDIIHYRKELHLFCTETVFTLSAFVSFKVAMKRK